MKRIGEKLNSSIGSTRELMTKRDGDRLAALAKRQLDAGADWLDVNAALFLEAEAEVLAWAVQAVQASTNARLMIDSTNPAAVAAALAADRVGGAIVNSVTADPARLDQIAPLLAEHGASVVVLCMGGSGIPPTAQGRAEEAGKALEGLCARGVPPERVWLDPLVETLAANHNSARVTLDTIGLLRSLWPDTVIVCGLSNISYGLPNRRAINGAFFTAAACAGLDAAIFDVTDPAMRQAAAAAWAVAGRDAYCMEYIRHCRERL
jgi:5-methyltetrahydrofolate--homocysteine methyltransferase